MINENLSDLVQARRGLTLGDPIPPYIFLLIREFLNRCLNTFQEEPNYN